MSTFDTAIVGGGPAGSTVATLLRKYDPTHRVLVLERERFPRDHIGESQLPVIGAILDEMGCWDKVEAADFPIKVGATYRWGTTPDLWNFNFLPHGELEAETRPARYEGQRVATAFQVDRAIYDKILLDHAAEAGAEVREGVKVVEVLREGDRVTGFRLDDGEVVEARHYVDASGGGGLLRRAMGVEVDSPTTLRNIAIWDYFQNADWAVEIGVGGTRIQVLSLGYGWIWFIPLGPTRTSVGLVIPASYYKESGMRPAELFEKALKDETRVASLMKNATSEGKLQTTNDWSFLAERMTGENWFLAGDSCGFADPILSAGMTLAHAGAREIAYTILELDRGETDAAWLKSSYDEGQSRRIRQHIRFADYWYSVNAQFGELKEFTTQIAKDAGLDLDPDRAFQWLGTGGFVNDTFQGASVGTFSVAAVKQLAQIMSEGDASWEFCRYNEFRLDLVGAKEKPFPQYFDGRVVPVRSYERNGKRLPLTGPFLHVVSALQREREAPKIISVLRQTIPRVPGMPPEIGLMESLQSLEAMLAEGWVKGKVDRKKPLGLAVPVESESPMMEFDRT
jgi:flavin-dependent dehydrogenase